VKKSFSVLLFLPLLSGCFLLTKEEEEPDDRNARLTQSDWKSVGYGTDDNGNGQLDPAESVMPDCEQDDYYYFFTDNELRVSIGSNKCYTTQTDYTTTWYFAQSQTRLQLGINALAPVEYEIIDLTFTRLELQRTINGKRFIWYWNK
jgi:hypothetical protein